MAKGRTSDPNQYTLVPGGDPSEHARKEEEKNEVRTTTHECVVAYCETNKIEPPSPTQWFNGQQVLTYMIHKRGYYGICPTVKDIAQQAWYPQRKSESVAERAITMLGRLGVLSTMRGQYIIHFTWLAEIRSCPAPQVACENRHSNRHEPSSRRSDDGQMTVQRRSNDGSHYIPLNQNLPPTTTGDGSDDGSSDAEWVVVVAEVRSCGINQATAAVKAARVQGAPIAYVRSLLAYWRKHREGWKRPDVVLYRRLPVFDAELRVDEAWQSFDNADYEERLLLAEQRRSDEDRTRAWLAERDANRQQRAACERERTEAPFSLVEQAAACDEELAAGIVAKRVALGIAQCQTARKVAKFRERRGARANGQAVPNLHIQRVLERMKQREEETPAPPLPRPP